MDYIYLYNLIPDEVDKEFVKTFIDELKKYDIKEEYIIKSLLTASLSIPLIRLVQKASLSHCE